MASDASVGIIPRSFVELATLGRNEWWRYVLGILVISGVAIAGIIIFLVTTDVIFPGSYSGETVNDWRTVKKITALLEFTGIFFGFTCVLFGVILVTVFIHKRTWRTLITSSERFRWHAFVFSFGLTSSILLIYIAISLVFFPDDIHFIFEAQSFFYFLPFVLVLLPLQVLAEEVFFRGYLLQLTARLSRKVIVRILVPAALFWMIHLLNEEVQIYGMWAVIDYALMALYFTFLAIKGNGLEYVIGLHLANNLFAILVVGNPSVWYLVPTILIAERDYPMGLIATIILFSAHYWLLFRWHPFENSRPGA